MARKDQTADSDVASPAPARPIFGRPSSPKISAQARTPLNRIADSITHSAGLGLFSAVAKLRSTWKPNEKGRPMHSMAVNCPAPMASTGSCPRWSRIHRLDSRIGISGIDSRMALHRPMRTTWRTPAFAFGLAPIIWATMGETAEAGPLPTSQQK